MDKQKQEDLRMAVRFFYDLQKLRIQTTHRSISDTADLEDDDQSYLATAGSTLNELEKGVLREVSKLLKGVPIYEQFLKDVKGVGPTMAGVIVAEIDIHRAPTASSLWAYCGLAVDPETGKAVRRQKGKKANWNPFVKTKMIGVLADCIIKADGMGRARAMKTAIDQEKGEAFLGSLAYATVLDVELNAPVKADKHGVFPVKVEQRKALVEHFGLDWRAAWPDRDPWVPFYENYKHRLETMRKACTACASPELNTGPTGKVKKLDAAGKPVLKDKKPVFITCNNCNGTLIGPWGNSQAHRHNAAKRYMIKQFLLELHKQWRKLEGLEVRPPYAEEYLGIKHHESGASAHP